MNKRLSAVLGLGILLAVGLWVMSLNHPAATPVKTAVIPASGAPAFTPPTASADQTVDSPRPKAPRVIPRAVATVMPRVGVRRVPTASDAVPINGRPPASMPLASDFLDQIIDATGTRAAFTLPDGRAAVGTIELLRRDSKGALLVQGRLTQPESGFYFFQRQTAPGVAGALVGAVRFDRNNIGFRVDPTGATGAPMLVEHRLDQVVCLNLEAPDLGRMAAAEPQDAPQTHPINIPIPDYQNGVVPLQSLPGALGVIYLDFDGEKGPFSGWSGNYDAAPSGATNAEIKEVWQRVAEDYQPFNINVTTDRKVFDNAPQGSRQHCILTPTTDAAPGAGGVSYIGSFNWTGDTPNWSFYWSGKAAAEVVSHECGHALGLGHDGRVTPNEGYYAGHGSGETGWAPIMGVGYYQNLVQWSKGEYTSANNTEDDLAIIVGNNNNVDNRVDDYTATFATAPYLEILADDTVSNEGIIETRTDVDAFRFTTAGGSVSFTVSTVNAGPNLDILAEIYDSANALVASNNPDLALSATVTATLGAGDFTLRVSGVGRGSALVDGYTDYDSLGAYLITGTCPGGVKPDRLSIAENSAVAAPVGSVTPRNDHGANPLTFAITSGNTGNAFAINPTTGAVTVATPSQLNYETLSTRWDDPATFQLFVTITDTTNPALNETIRVVVTVTDVNELPSITGGAITIPEHARVGTKVFKVTGSDPDRFEFPLFSIVAGNTGNAFAIDAVSGQITIAGDTEASIQSVYALTVRATDHGTPALTADATVTITLINIPSGYQPGALVRTFYEGIGGNNVSDLTGNANFPNSPSSQVIIPSFDGGSNHGDNYGDTIRGWLIPPTTGSYTFWIASDDGGELRISTNATSASAVVRATVAGAVNQYQWGSGSQQSIALSLTAGTPYYIESRHKEGGGADHVAVAWQGPGISQQVIGGAYLALQSLDLTSPTSTSVNIPANVGIAIEPSNAGRTGTTFAWTKVSGPGAVTFDNAAALATGATFSSSGTYVLRCTESGGAAPITLDLTVNSGVVDYGLAGSKVGAQALQPAHTLGDGVYNISAAGAGIPSGATPDDFYFINTPMTGNVTVTARVVSVQNIAGSSSRAGVMIRESLAEDAREAFVGVTSANGGRFIYRATDATASASATANVAQPYWVRLTRTGDSFTAQIAPDSSGTPGAFSAIGTAQTITMSGGVFVGLAATSGSASAAGAIVIDNVSIVPGPVNIGALVSAGPDASAPFPANATLDGTVSDDAKPAPPGAFTTAWTKLSGAGSVTFGNAAAIDTSASFSLPGIYTLRLTADDGAVKTFDDIAINANSATTVNITANDPAASEQGVNTGQFTFTRTGPTAGALTVNFTVAGTASASDYAALPATVVIPDGLTSTTLLVTPVDDALIEGPETVILTLAGGFYNIGASSIATVTIADNDVAPTVTITSPTSANVNVPASTGLILEATTTDDGLPNPLVLTWSKVSGLGTVTFGTASAANSTATFSLAGTYVLRLTANDGQFTGTDDVTVNVGSIDQHFTGSKVGTQSVPPGHTIAAGAYTMTAGGTGIPSGGSPDDFYFLNTAITGDVTITARVVSVQNVNASNSRAGVMIRDTLAADSREAFCGITSINGQRFIYRATAAASSANSPNNPAQTPFAPYWVRLVRSGDSFTATVAPDSSGTPGAFTALGTPQTLTMGSTVFVGLASTSGSTTASGTIVFDKITITPAIANVAATVSAGLDASVTPPASATLDGTVADDGKPAPLVTTWSKVIGPGAVTFGDTALVDTSASFTVGGSYVLRLIANDGEVKTYDDTTITVNLPPIEQWRLAHFGANAGNPAIAGDLANPDGDAYSNLLEYALGLDPLAAGPGGIVADIETIGPDKFLRLTVTRNAAATDITFSIEVNGDLTAPASWSSAGTTVETNTATQLRARDNTPVSSPAHRSIRLKVTLP